MNKTLLLAVLIGAMPLYATAQDDDLYFKPKKKTEISSSNVEQKTETPTYYAGSSRSVDEYNRRGKYWSHYQKIGTDESGNDVIEFQKGKGVYPDSAYIDTTFVGKYYDTIVDDDDYAYSRRMSRWDGFYDPWFYSYRWGYGPYWRYSWYNPWYYSAWYDPWYDPWYYGWGYGYPYYGGYYGWGYPYYGGYWGYPHHWGGHYVANVGGNPRGYTGYRSWSGPGRSGNASSNAYASRGNSYSRSHVDNRSFGGRTNNTYNRNNSTRTYTPSNSSSNRSFGNSSSGSFGGSHSGSFGGGARSMGGGGGGRFGGGHR